MGLADVLFKVTRGDVLTPLVDQYWKRPRGPVFARDTMEVLSYLATRPPRDRTRSFSASSIDSCMRLQTLRNLNYPQVPLPVDPELMSLFHDGHWRHLRWQGVFLEMGLVVMDDQPRADPNMPWYRGGYPYLEVPVELEDWGFRGTIDVLARIAGELVVIDVKGAHSYVFTKAKEGEVSRGYRWQLQAYLEAIHAERAILWYEDKATQHYAERIIQRDSVDAAAARARAAGLQRYFERRELPPPLAKYPTALECRRCPFLEDCRNLRWTDEHLL